MSLDLASATASLKATADTIRSLVSAVPQADAGWKPAPDRWSVLEVINHLADEEVEDFRARIDVILHRPTDDFAPIDPPRWVTERRYAERDLLDSLDRFMAERARSLTWLKGLDDAQLDRFKEHVTAGRMSGRQLLASWMAHDLLHVKQLARLRYDRLAERAAPLSLAYAGEWR